MKTQERAWPCAQTDVNPSHLPYIHGAYGPSCKTQNPVPVSPTPTICPGNSEAVSREQREVKKDTAPANHQPQLAIDQLSGSPGEQKGWTNPVPDTH